MAAKSPELVQRAHDLLNAPHLFGMEVGLNLPAFIIALMITAILVMGIKESARFNATIVVMKVAVVLFVIGSGLSLCEHGNWGGDWSSFAPYGLSGIGAGAAYIFFAYIGFDAVSTTAQEAKNPQRDLPIGIIVSLLICTVLVYRGGGGAYGHGAVARGEYRSADRARLHGSRPDDGVAHHHAGRVGGADQRDAGDAAGADASAVFHGQRWTVAEEILC